MRAKPKQFADKQDDEQPDKNRSSLMCSVPGCPLAGTVSHSTAGGNWLCFAHFGHHEKSQWPWLTKGIRDNLWLFRVGERLATMPAYDFEQRVADIDGYLRSRGREDLCRLPNGGQWPERTHHEPRTVWAMRIQSAAYTAAKKAIDEGWTTATKPPESSPADLLRELVEEHAL